MTNARQDALRRKSAARLFAVQALYQMEVAGEGLDEVLAEFEDMRFGADYDIGQMAQGDPTVFRTLLESALTHQAKIDQATDKALVARWPINKIDPVLRALFRAGGGELLSDATPPKVVIKEFVDVAAAFFPEAKEVRFVNAVLDHMARALKPEMFE